VRIDLRRFSRPATLNLDLAAIVPGADGLSFSLRGYFDLSTNAAAPHALPVHEPA